MDFFVNMHGIGPNLRSAAGLVCRVCVMAIASSIPAIAVWITGPAIRMWPARLQAAMPARLA